MRIDRCSRREQKRAVFCAYGLVGLPAVFIALAFAAGLPMIRHVRSEQLAGDPRTVAAMVHYSFEGDGPALKNVIEPWPKQANLAMPTNIATVEPKA